MVIWVWILMTMNAEGVIQQSYPMATKEECLQLAEIVHVFADTGTLCLKRKIVIPKGK
jgi:hypothetical protein